MCTLPTLELVLLSGVTCVSKMRPTLVQKQRKALLVDQRMERCELLLWSPGSSSKGRGWGRFLGFSSAVRRQSCRKAGAAVLLRLQIVRSVGCGASAQGPPPSWIAVSWEVSWGRFRAQPWAEVFVKPFHRNGVWFWTLVWRVRCEPSASGPLWASETRQGTKERKKKRLDFIVLPRFYFYFLGIVNGPCWWHVYIYIYIYTHTHIHTLRFWILINKCFSNYINNPCSIIVKCSIFRYLRWEMIYGMYRNQRSHKCNWSYMPISIRRAIYMSLDNLFINRK